MERVQTNPLCKRKTRTRKRFSLPIGMRLSLAFMTIILLTGLIGLLAIQQISSLTNKAAELNTRDLPESLTLEHLRSLLYQQDDLEHSLINGDNLFPDQPAIAAPLRGPFTENRTQNTGTTIQLSMAVRTLTPQAGNTPGQQTQEIGAELMAVLNAIEGDCQQLVAFERAEQGKDFALVQQVTATVLKTRVLSKRIQMLVAQKQRTQARMLDFTQQEPLLLSAITTVTQLSSAEHVENTQDTSQTQLNSRRSSLFVLALTILCLLLSLVLAILITRSLTRPLNALLKATEEIAAGNLNVHTQIERTDEIGRLATAYDTMRVSLRSTIASLRRERQQTQAIIDAAADGIILVDGEQKIVQWNPAAEHLTAWRIDEAQERYWWDVLGVKESSTQAGGVNEPLSPLIEAFHTRSEPFSLELFITSHAGTPRWLAITCAPMPLEKGEAEHHMVIGLHDISQFKAVEHLKSDFIAVVSHELRAPLTTVIGSVEILSRLDPTNETEAYQEVLSILTQQTRRLRQVVEEVLQLTRFEAGHLEAHICALSLTPFLRHLVDTTNAEWSNRDHCILLHVSPQEQEKETQVWADSGLLEIVLRNLFENARKYTPQGTVVEVEMDVLASTGQTHVRIIDTGPGIPEDQLEQIFERFSRGTQSPGDWTRGYGLGLYIARELMQVQNGSIWADSRRHGACFTLTLWTVLDEPDSITEAEE